MHARPPHRWQENQNNVWFSPLILFILIGVFIGWSKAWVAFIIFPFVVGIGAYLFNQYAKSPHASAWTPDETEKHKRGERNLTKRKNDEDDDEEPLIYYVGDDGELIEMPREKRKYRDPYDQPPKYV